LLDIGLTAGYGAMPDRDGIDTGGTLGSPFSSIANVETYEYRYPILYLWRRHEPDSGGLGEYRGGLGISLAFTPHRARAALDIVLHGLGCSVPSTPGLGGGQPGATNTFAVVRSSAVAARLQQGQIPGPADPLEGKFQPAPGLYKTTLVAGDVLLAHNNGGGGFGDPLAREPARVAADLAWGAVSAEWASHGYGVVLDGPRLDEAATRAHRAALRQARLPHPAPTTPPAGDSPPPTGAGACPDCGTPITRATVVARRTDLHACGRFILPYAEQPRFAAAETLCARCGRLLDAHIVPIDGPTGLPGSAAKH
jgi:N-methylhydantoinase B